VMGCSESAVESLLVRGYAQLRQRLAQWAAT
jgi:DNA-directed RNA polymerase specialized sigma24 family protein